MTPAKTHRQSIRRGNRPQARGEAFEHFRPPVSSPWEKTQWRKSMSAETGTRRDKRVLRIAVIALAIIEAIVMVPLVLHLANK